MKLYRIAYPGAKPELVKLDTDKGPVKSVELGESGRGRIRKIIPIIGEGPEVRVKRTDKGIVLVRGDWEDSDRILAIINTMGDYDRFRNYGMFMEEGVENIDSGFFAFGDAGRINGGSELLAIVTIGGVFKLNSKYTHTWYMFTEEGWVIETPEERRARLALIEVEQGGGEWL